MYSILYVDDEDVLLGLNKVYLEKSGQFSVDTAQSATEGLDMIDAGTYDAIISDYDMPVMDGLVFLREVRKRHGDVPFLLFTGKGREEVVIEAVEHGVDFYIQKGHDMQGMIAELSYKTKRAIEQRQIRAELERSRQQTSDIINFLPDPTFVRDMNGRVIAWNYAMEALTGMPREVMLGKDNYEYALPFYGERCPLLADLVLEKDPEIHPRFRFFQRDGEKISAEVTIPQVNRGKGARMWVAASPLYDADGAVTGAIETFRDISDYYAVKRDLELSREMNRGFAEMVPVGVYEMDLAGTLTFSNRHCRELFALSDDDLLVPLNVLDYIVPEDRARAAADIRDVAHGKVSRGQEYLLRRKDNTTFPALIVAGAVTDPESREVVGVRGIIVDLTERKQEARALHESRERLALAMKAGDIGIWDVDLRTDVIHDIHDWARGALGYRCEDLPEITVETARSLVHPLDLPQILFNFFMHVSGKEPLFESLFRLLAKDGTWIPVAVRGKVIERDQDGEPVRLTGTINVSSTKGF